MPNKHTYEFAIVRVVPKVEREEFINVGVLVFCKRQKYLGLKYLVNEKKLLALTGEIEPALLNQYLEAWSLICQGSPNGGPIGALDVSDRFRWLAASKSTILQCSKTHAGLCANPAQVLEDTFEKLVG